MSSQLGPLPGQIFVLFNGASLMLPLLFPDPRNYQVAGTRHATGLLRAVFAGFARGATVTGQPAVHEARKIVPAQYAGSLVGAVQRMVRELGSTRVSRFNYIPTRDVHSDRFVTPEETHFLRLCVFSLAGDAAGAQTQLVLLCEGGQSDGVFSAVDEVCDLLRATRAAA